MRPFGVTTPLLGMMRNERTITPAECVFSVMADLGKTDTTFSGFPHKLIDAVWKNLREKEIFDQYVEKYDFVKKKW